MPYESIQELANRASRADVTTVHASAAETTTTQSTGVDMSVYDNALALLNVTAVSGTTPTLDVKFQTSDDNVTFYDLPNSSFTQITAVTKPAALVLSQVGKYLRAAYTIAGTTPSFTFTLNLVAKTSGS